MCIKNTTWSFDIGIHYEIFATVNLTKTSLTSCSYFFCVMRMLEMCSVRKFQVYNTVWLTIVTMLYIRSPELSHFITKFVPFDQYLFTFPIPQPLATTILFSGSMSSTLFFFSDSIYKWYRTIFVFLCLAYFTKCNVLQFIYVVINGRISFFFYGWIIFCFVYISASLSINPSVDTWVVSMSWLLWIML